VAYDGASGLYSTETFTITGDAQTAAAPPTPPAAPLSTTLTKSGSEQLACSWAAPPTVAGVEITNYKALVRMCWCPGFLWGGGRGGLALLWAETEVSRSQQYQQCYSLSTIGVHPTSVVVPPVAKPVKHHELVTWHAA
jgi:hypothetical protein